jgi:hypothetical protein
MIGSSQSSKDVLYSSGKNDECYTPDYAVEPLLEFIPKDKIIWCPFDTEESEFVKIISQTNPVVHSHIWNSQDFFNYEPEEWDIIISNPPFQGKRKFFERALSFNKPFALLMTMAWMNEAAPVQLFENRGLQLLLFDKRVEFIQPNAKKTGKITFNSSYFCCDFLPNDIVMRRLNKTGSKAKLPL